MPKSEHIVKYTAEELREMRARGEDKTDWVRVRALTHEEIEASIDFQDEGEFDLDQASANYPLPQPTRLLTVRLDGDIIEWFKETGKGYQTRMNAVLRIYVEAQKRQDLERFKRERAETAASGE
jgi:uncharacterized protein (DUF4415 family)